MSAALRRVGERPWLALAPILAGAAVVLLAFGGGGSFSGDELWYFGRQAYLGADTPRHFDSLTLEYLFVPYNGHLQVGGKLVYEALFAVFGADYTAFRVVGVAGVLACVALFFELARVRIGVPAALLASILLALFGAAWEVLLWPFDLHTTFAVAAGLGALLALERGGRHGDAIACVLLVFALCFIEIALAFVAAAAVAILIGRGSLAAHLGGRGPSGAVRRLVRVGAGLCVPAAGGRPGRPAAVGLRLPARHDERAHRNDLEWSGCRRLSRGPGRLRQLPRDRRAGPVRLAPRSRPVAARLLACAHGAGGVYWVMIAFAARQEDSSRYVFAGALLLLLVAASSVRERRPAPVQLAALAVLVALALPANLSKLSDGSEYLDKDAVLTRGEFAMLELAGERGDPDYLPVTDKLALAVGASPYLVMPTAVYLDAAERIGSLADSLDRIRE